MSSTPRRAFGAGQLELLERIANGEPLAELLDGIVRLLEAQNSGMVCSIFWSDGKARGFRGSPTPSSSTGLVRSTENPILSSTQEVLGTLAIHFREDREPSEDEQRWISVATHLAAIAIVRDRSEQTLRRSEARYRDLARLYEFSSTVAEAIVRMRAPQALYDFACRIAVKHGLARLAWIGMRDETSGRLTPVARFGHDEGCVDLVAERLNEPDTNRAPVRRALQSGTYATSNDLANDEGFIWKEEALARGFRSCAVFPLRIGERSVGVFALYADQVGSFDPETARVLDKLASDIAFAVEAAANQAERSRLLHELGERVKELTLVHQVASVLQDNQPVDAQLLTRLAALIPPAFQYPEVCEAKIVWDGASAATPGFEDTPWQLRVEFQSGSHSGEIVVGYREDRTDRTAATQSAFLVEERQLLRSVADMLATYFARRA